jgi:hypothetical protein
MSQPAALINGMVVRCARCRTDDYGLPDHQLDEHHFGVRFRNCDYLRGRVTVKLEGVDVTRDCYEAYAGFRYGWVALFVTNSKGSRIVCANDPTHAVVEIHRGNVRVQRRQAG